MTQTADIFGAVRMGYAVVQSSRLDDWRRFLKQGVGLHLQSDSPELLAFRMDRHLRRLMIERGPWEAQPPLETLRAAPFPKLVVSGGWSAPFDAVCDVLEERLGAERAVLPGMGHSPQLLGAPFNDVLTEFLHQKATPTP